MTTEIRIAYWFCQGDAEGGYYSLNKPDEKWRVGQTRSLRGKIIPCEHGYHGSPSLWDALVYAPGSVACLVELSGDVTPHGNPVDKYAARTRKLLAAVNIERKLLLYAADCAEHVLWIYERDYPGDDRPRKVIQVARDFAEGRVEAADTARAAGVAWDAMAAAAAWATAGGVGGACAVGAARAAEAVWAAAEAAEAARAAGAARDAAGTAGAAGAAGAARDAAWTAGAAKAARSAAGAARAAEAAEQAWQREQFEVRFAHIFD